MSTRAAEKQLQSIIGGQAKAQKSQKGTKGDKLRKGSIPKSVKKSTSKPANNSTGKNSGVSKVFVVILHVYRHHVHGHDMTCTGRDAGHTSCEHKVGARSTIL